MNYEEKYKEALGWMRSIYPTMQGAEKEDAEHYFPELKESEDEQHRKWILEYLYDGLRKSDEQFKDQYKSAIAWLEKQGEQKPIEKTKHINHSYITSSQEFFQWIYDRLIYVHNENPNVDYMISLKERIDDMKTLVWSEEDEKKIMWLVRLISTAGFRELDNDKMPCTRTELIDWLKSIKVRSILQPKQEWSEEDEKMKNLIIKTLTSMGTLNLERYYHMNLDEVKEWLKSIKPNHWKPSEEQIKSLRIALQTMPYSKDKENVLIILEELMKL